MADSESFYAQLLGQEKSFGDASDGYVGFVLENASILLEPIEAGEFEAGRYLGFSLEVPDIHAFYENLKGSATFTGPPEPQSWSGFMTHVSDSSGNTLSIVEITDDA
jgi:predicted enzyme related to lactoylglutathione lyase